MGALVVLASLGIVALIGCVVVSLPAISNWFEEWMYD